MGLSVALITYNEEANLKKFLDAVYDIATEIVVVDSYSTDKTTEICNTYSSGKIKFFEKKFNGYGEQKNYALNLCSEDWVLFLDADEIPDDELKESIKKIISNPNPEFKVYKIKLRNHLGIHHIRYGGWGNVFRERLFQRKFAKYTDDKVHESLVTSEKVGLLAGNIDHYTYKNIHHHISKINKYSDMMAEKMFKKGKKINHFKIIASPIFEFLKVFIFKLGFLDGYTGYYVAKAMAHYTFLKYMKLYERVTYEKQKR